jgi:hypothetical protein
VTTTGAIRSVRELSDLHVYLSRPPYVSLAPDSRLTVGGGIRPGDLSQRSSASRRGTTSEMMPVLSPPTIARAVAMCSSDGRQMAPRPPVSLDVLGNPHQRRSEPLGLCAAVNLSVIRGETKLLRGSRRRRRARVPLVVRGRAPPQPKASRLVEVAAVVCLECSMPQVGDRRSLIENWIDAHLASPPLRAPVGGYCATDAARTSNDAGKQKRPVVS